jgi:hypothetical protein
MDSYDGFSGYLSAKWTATLTQLQDGKNQAGARILVNSSRFASNFKRKRPAPFLPRFMGPV